MAASVFRPGLFRDRVAIVTGGGTGLGKAIAKELLYLGCKVVIASRNTERLHVATQELSSKIKAIPGAEVSSIQCNIRKEDEVKNLISTTLERYKKLDFLVNNGGGQFISPSSQLSARGWSAVVDTNLTGTFFCCREAYTQWMGEHGGSIVNIIVDLLRGTPGMAHTGAARAGVESFTKSAAVEWSSDGVRINCVAPGAVYTDSAAEYYMKNAGKNPFETQREHIPFKRCGTADEVSSAVCWLLSPGASYVTGDTIVVDGANRYHPTMWPIPEHKKMPPYEWDIPSKSKL